MSLNRFASFAFNSTLLTSSLNSSDYADYDFSTTNMINISSYDNSSEALDTYVNNSNSKEHTSSNLSSFYPVLITEMVFSVIGLIITIFVYSILPEFRNVHGKNLISLCSCMLTAFVFLILDLSLRNHISYKVCFAFSIFVHVSFLGTFFWTQVMAYDIWRTMSRLKPKSEAGSNESKKYLKYSIYAWSATVLTALPAIILDGNESLPDDYRPRFGTKRCWLTGTKAFVIYFNAPVGVILFFNLIMFLLTMRSLLQLKKMTDNLNIKQHQQRFHLYLKLFLVMGIIWTTEFLPWATGIYKLYALAGVLTALHGVLLFVIFVCKHRILKQVCEKLNISLYNTPSLSTTSKKSTSSTSQPLTFSSSASYASTTKV